MSGTACSANPSSISYMMFSYIAMIAMLVVSFVI